MFSTAHTSSSINTSKPVSSGLFNWQHPEQSITKQVERHEYKIQANQQPASSFFTSNLPIDYKIPDEISGYCKDTVLRFTLANAHATLAVTVNTSPCFWFNRLEVMHGGEILQTIRADELFLNNTMYLTEEEMFKNQTFNLLDRATFALNTSDNTIPSLGSKSLNLKLRTLLESGVVLGGLTKNITIRIYPEPIGNWCNDVNVASLSLSSAELWVREVKFSKAQTTKANMAYRYLDYSHEQAQISLTSGTTTKYITNNYQNELASHILVLVRNSGATLGNLEILHNQNNVYLEDESGRNLHNGNQYTDAELKQEYLHNFPNVMAITTNKNMYVFTASEFPTDDHKNGNMNGSTVLKQNFKVCINSAATATRQVDIYARVYRLVLVNNGKITLG